MKRFAFSKSAFVNGCGLLLFVLLLATTTSCSLHYIAINSDDHIKKVDLGMSKEEVVRIMGNRFRNAGASTDDFGAKVEVLSYANPTSEEYKLTFVDGKLKEWNKERVYEYKVVEKRR